MDSTRRFFTLLVQIFCSTASQKLSSEHQICWLKRTLKQLTAMIIEPSDLWLWSSKITSTTSTMNGSFQSSSVQFKLLQIPVLGWPQWLWTRLVYTTSTLWRLFLIPEMKDNDYITYTVNDLDVENPLKQETKWAWGNTEICSVC